MKKQRIIAIFILLLGLIIGSCIFFSHSPVTISDSQALPPYIMPIYTTTDTSQYISLGNAFLIDLENRLFATMAHQFDWPGEMTTKIWIFNKWYLIKVKEKWINWDADIAIVQLITDRNIKLPRAGYLKNGLLEKESVINVKGYQHDGKSTFKKLGLDPHSLKGLVLNPSAYWSNPVEMAKIKIRQLKGETISKGDRSYLYMNYIYFSFETEQESYASLSGSPVLQDEYIVAMLSAAGDNGLAIPAFEISNLLEKVRDELNQSREIKN
ncbi:hypothetical protein IID20_04560 [Patescibacteria group bacterium]|nr:hypothetical protein [Patescibacteria group bacterium]